MINRKNNFVVLSLFYVSSLSFLIVSVSGKENFRNETATKERKWLTQLFSDAERNFDMDPLVSSQCLKDFSSYKMNLKAQIGWAVRMLESSEWPSVGLLSGTTTHLGNWDECLLVSMPNMQGKYCLIEGSYGFDKIINNNSALEVVEWPSDELTVWEILRMFEKNPVRAERKTIQWALCIPSSCNNQDLEMSLRKMIYPLFQNQDLDFHLQVNQSSCHVNGENEFSREFYYTVVFFVFILLLVCFSTFYEYLKRPEKVVENQELIDLITSFSLIRNFNQLLRHSKKNDFGFVHALKFVSLAIIIYGHRRLFSYGYPNFNPERTEINFKKLINYVELTHLTFVDVFFMLTGFLTFHLDFSAMSKHGIRYWFVALIHRWLRLIPAFGITVIFLIYIFPYISDGPLWNDKVAHEINHCKASWWTNLLAVNNIVRTEDQCLVISWYMSADMQLASVGLGLLYITTKNRKWGWISIILTYIVGAVVTFSVAYAHKFHGVLPIYVSFLQNPNGSENFRNFYIASYTRIGPYLIGVMAALITKSLKEKNFTFSTKQKIVGLSLIFLIGEGYQHLGYVIEYEFGRQYNAIEHALYAATYRSMFVLPCAMGLCIYFTTGFSMLEKCYENKLFAVIGRLTYSVFLVNTVIQFLHAASQRSVLPNSILMNRFWWVVADVLFSYFFGTGMYLLLEAPIANLSKLIKQKLLKKSTDRSVITLSKDEKLTFSP